jgi:membrane-bound ClpP family serine protease
MLATSGQFTVKSYFMDLKQTFGAILTILGIIGLIYGAYLFLAGGGSLAGMPVDRFSALVPFVVGLIFFFSGISLIKRTPDHR